MEYHKTRDIVYVQKLLGHRSITNTMRYVRLMLFPDDEFTSKVAGTVREAQELVKSGFDYACDVDEQKIFRKRK